MKYRKLNEPFIDSRGRIVKSIRRTDSETTCLDCCFFDDDSDCYSNGCTHHLLKDDTEVKGDVVYVLTKNLNNE